MGMMNRKELAKLKPGVRVKPVCVCGPGLTKQEFANETNINTIMKRYKSTGDLPRNMRGLQPVFADVSAMGDYAESLRRIDAAKDGFMKLPAALRLRFGNQPNEFLAFLHDNVNRDEAVKLGLIPPVAESLAPPAPVVAVPIVPPLK